MLQIATAPGSWGVSSGLSTSTHDARPPWGLVLDEIAAAGYDGTELGPLDYLPAEAPALRDALAARGLALAAGYVMAPLADPETLDATLARARRTCRLLADAGAAQLVLIDAVSPERSRTAGRSAAAERLDDARWARLVATTDQLAREARRHGLAASFHPHAGSSVEFADEVERLLEETDPELVGLCLDTGHCLYAGIDPLELYGRHARRVRYLHLKDVDADALARALARELSFQQAVAEGVFCRLGDGSMDFAALRQALADHSYRGWATVEQDRLPEEVAGARADAAASLAHLRAQGIAIDRVAG